MARLFRSALHIREERVYYFIERPGLGVELNKILNITYLLLICDTGLLYLILQAQILPELETPLKIHKVSNYVKNYTFPAVIAFLQETHSSEKK